MKRLFLVSLIAGLLVGATSVNAMTEAELKAKLEQTYTINGEKFAISSDMKALVDKYLNENEVSSKDADYIASKVDEAVAIIKASGVTSLDKLSSSSKDELKALVSDVNANTEVNATVSNGSIVILNDDGSVFAKTSNVVKQTGAETSVVAYVAGIAFVITAVGACLVVRQVRNN